MIRNIFRKIKKVLSKEKQPTSNVSHFEYAPPDTPTPKVSTKGKPHRYGRISLGTAAVLGRRYRHTNPMDIRDTT